MQIITGRRRSITGDRRGLSNIIIVVLGLVILVAVVLNIILWSYQMNQLDWDKMQENVGISAVARVTVSPWFVAQSEYQVNQGSRVSGSYLDTQAVDGSFESFRETAPPRAFDFNGTFALDVSTYPITYIKSVEIQLRYRVSDIAEKWFLEAYNWTSRTYSNNGFNSTAGHTPSLGWNYYAVNLTNKWQNYVKSDGSMLIKVHDQGPDTTRTNIDIDFLGVRATLTGTIFTFQNKSSRTAHIVAIWVNNSTVHKRYDADAFVNSGETFSYQRVDILLPSGQYTVKVVTERGNIAVYSTG